MPPIKSSVRERTCPTCLSLFDYPSYCRRHVEAGCRGKSLKPRCTARNLFLEQTSCSSATVNRSHFSTPDVSFDDSLPDGSIQSPFSSVSFSSQKSQTDTPRGSDASFSEFETQGPVHFTPPASASTCVQNQFDFQTPRSNLGVDLAQSVVSRTPQMSFTLEQKDISLLARLKRFKAFAKSPLTKRQLERRDAFLREFLENLYESEDAAKEALLRLTFGNKRCSYLTRERLFQNSAFQGRSKEFSMLYRKTQQDSPQNVDNSLAFLFSGGKCSKRDYKEYRALGKKSSLGVPLVSWEKVSAGAKSLDVGTIKFMTSFKFPSGKPESSLGLRRANLTEEEISEQNLQLQQARVNNEIRVVGACFDFEEQVSHFLKTYEIVDEYLLANGKEPILKFFNSVREVHCAETGGKKTVPCKQLVIRVGIDGFPMKQNKPHTAMSFSSPNLGPRCNSPKYNHLLMGCSLKENAPQVLDYIRVFETQAAAVEKNEYALKTGEPLQINVGIVAADQSMGSDLLATVGQTANCFSYYAQGTKDDYGIFTGEIGKTEENATFTALSYAERLQLAARTEEQRIKIQNTPIRGGKLPSAEYVHNKVIEFMRLSKNRQLGDPPLGFLSDHVFCCILHLGINNFGRLFSEFFFFVCKITTELYRDQKLPLFEDLRPDDPIVVLLDKMARYQNFRNLRTACTKAFGKAKSLGESYHFIGRDVKTLCHVFSTLVSDVYQLCRSDSQRAACLRFLVTGTYLRDVLKCANRFYVSSAETSELQSLCELYYKSAILLHDLKFPGAWTVRYVIPYHLRVLRETYGVVHDGKYLGLGATSTEAIESTHVVVKKYSTKTNPQRKWRQILRYHAYARLALRRKDPEFLSGYRHTCNSYVSAAVEQGLLCYCGRPFGNNGERCDLCNLNQTQDLREAVSNGLLSDALKALIYPYLNSTTCQA